MDDTAVFQDTDGGLDMIPYLVTLFRVCVNISRWCKQLGSIVLRKLCSTQAVSKKLLEFSASVMMGLWIIRQWLLKTPITFWGLYSVTKYYHTRENFVNNILPNALSIVLLARDRWSLYTRFRSLSSWQGYGLISHVFRGNTSFATNAWARQWSKPGGVTYPGSRMQPKNELLHLE